MATINPNAEIVPSAPPFYDSGTNSATSVGSRMGPIEFHMNEIANQ